MKRWPPPFTVSAALRRLARLDATFCDRILVTVKRLAMGLLLRLRAVFEPGLRTLASCSLSRDAKTSV